MASLLIVNVTLFQGAGGDLGLFPLQGTGGGGEKVER